MQKKGCDDDPGHYTGGGKGDCYFLLVNSKDVDAHSKSMLQEVVNLYMKELPAMNYAANTGKKSKFLEKCVSNGKFCTLVLILFSAEGPEQVISAITYQIIPSDMLYAEVPLAAVSSIHQLQGIGRLMYMELRRRLQSVGIRSIFCWGDKESEGFWHKQGFVPVGEVDAKGRARRLPIKADIHKALCFPGGSTLMVSHLSKDFSANPAELLDLSLPLKILKKSSTPYVAINQNLTGLIDSHGPSASMYRTISSQTKQPEELLTGCRYMIPIKNMDLINVATGTTGLGLSQIGADVDRADCSCSETGSKKRFWEASLTSLKSKRVKGSHLSSCELDSENISTSCPVDESSLTISKYEPLINAARRAPLTHTCLQKKAEDHAVANTSQEHDEHKLLPRREGFRIMLMNIADAAKRTLLIKIIEELGGATTSDGSVCTHVITGKVRKTLNFCTALCSGAWVLSPSWLKESCREGRFVDETDFILNDQEYELKYRIELKDAVLRAKTSPNALLKGYNICFAAHTQPPVSTLSTIVKSAGGNVVHDINEVDEASTIYVASEENMEEALTALKRGIRTFSTDWFMNCIMMQQMDLEAPQFAESL